MNYLKIVDNLTEAIPLNINTISNTLSTNNDLQSTKLYFKHTK